MPWPCKHNLGETEFNDQMAALKQALQQFPQLDGNRLGFWGWSYGGYFTLYTLEHTDMFKAGVAVAPVTDWRNYDSIYTERYMGLPTDNAEGYRKSSPVNFAANLHGNLLEVHGTSDDNVHMQNTIQMINAFINSGKQFELMMYPGKTHGIAGTGGGHSPVPHDREPLRGGIGAGEITLHEGRTLRRAIVFVITNRI